MEAATRRVIQEATGVLRGAGIEEPEREVYRILSLTLAPMTTMEAFWTSPPASLTEEQSERFQKLISRRAHGEPFAYLSQRREFFGLDLFIPPGVLIPRPETEDLVEAVLNAHSGSESVTARDVGCGSGAIALALKKFRPDWQIWATDLYCWPLMVTMINSYRLQLPLHCWRSDLLGSAVDGPPRKVAPGGRYDIICANLPYVSREDVHRMSGETKFEPEHALYAPDHGFALLERLIREAPACLADGGSLFLEVGAGQADRVYHQMRGQGFLQVEKLRDLSGVDRIVVGWWGGSENGRMVVGAHP